MDQIIEQLIGPTNPNDFVGRSDLIDQYNQLLMDFVRSNPTVRWVHISGVGGTGKSSLLRKFRMMTEELRIATGSVEVPISPVKANQFLTNIKQVIDEMSPEWRSFIQRYRNKEIYEVLAPPEANEEEVTDQVIKKMVKDFFEDLDRVDAAMKEEKDMKHGIFIDDLDRLLNYGYYSIPQVLSLIAKRLFTEEYNLLLVTAGHLSIDQYLGITKDSIPNYMLLLNLDQFDFTEAELMIRRRGKLVKSDREVVVQASTRFPFDLALRQLIQSKGLDPTTLDADILTKAFGMTNAEVALIRDLARHELNLYDLEEYTRQHSEDTIMQLSNALMFLVSQDGYFAFDSYALWELIKHVFKPIDPRTEVILILNRLKDQAEIGQLPSERDLKIVADHFKFIDDHALLFELSGQLSDAAKAALDGGLTSTAWEMLDIATIGLERTGDFEKIADLQETLAKGFVKVDHNYFAAMSFEKAGKFFREAGVEWRSITNFREAGQKYFREAENTDPKIYHYAIRSMLKNAIEAYLSANERSRAIRVINDAKDLLADYPQHIKYFEGIEILGE